MPRIPTLSIAGLYNYDETIFDGFRVPESISERREDIIDEICLEVAELELVYSNPDVMKFAITKWTNLNFKIWEELQATREYVYNPIWNKDGVVTETESREFAGTRSEQTSSQKTGAVTDEETEGRTGNKQTNTNRGENVEINRDSATYTTTTGEVAQETIKSVQGFNSTAWAEAEKEEMTGTSEETSNQVTQESGTEARVGTETGEEETADDRTLNRSNEYGETVTGAGLESTTDTGEITRERVEQGNIGVTTTQQMIKEQREVVQFSTERYIIDSFIDRFCLLVY